MPEHSRYGRLSRRALLSAALVSLSASALSACTISGPPPPSRWPHGTTGGTATDAAPALQSALDRAARDGEAVSLPPQRVFRLEAGIRVPSGTRLNGNGSTLINAASGDATCALSVVGAHDVILENLVIDGLKGAYAGKTEQRHNIRVSGSANVVLHRIDSHDAKGDGVYVGDQVNGASRQVVITDSIFRGNLRQGMSVTCASGLTVMRCAFSDTGGTPPGAGVDIEPNTPDSVIEDITFRSCQFQRNVGGGLLIVLSTSATAPQTGGRYEDCTFSDNQADGVFLVRSSYPTFIGCRVTGNGRTGVHIAPVGDPGSVVSDTTFSDCAITGNGLSGVLITSAYDRLEFDRCEFRGKGGDYASGFYGIDSSPPRGAGGRALIVRQSSFDNMLCGIRVNSATLRPALSGNTFSRVTEDVSRAP